MSTLNQRSMTREAHPVEAVSLLHLLHRASQVAEKRWLALATESAPRPRQLLVLQALSGRTSMNQTEIVELTGVDRSTVADLVKRLIRHGWVKRRRSRVDARAQIVSITDRGQAVIDAAPAMLKEVELDLLDLISAPNRQAFLLALQEVRDATINEGWSAEIVR